MLYVHQKEEKKGGGERGKKYGVMVKNVQIIQIERQKYFLLLKYL